jgi:hypothetical protein
MLNETRSSRSSPPPASRTSSANWPRSTPPTGSPISPASPTSAPATPSRWTLQASPASASASASPTQSHRPNRYLRPQGVPAPLHIVDEGQLGLPPVQFASLCEFVRLVLRAFDAGAVRPSPMDGARRRPTPRDSTATFGGSRSRNCSQSATASASRLGGRRRRSRPRPTESFLSNPRGHRRSRFAPSRPRARGGRSVQPRLPRRPSAAVRERPPCRQTGEA